MHGPSLFLIARSVTARVEAPLAPTRACPDSGLALSYTLPWGSTTPPPPTQTAHGTARTMTDTPASVAPPKKRSLFKRAAWQDAPKKDGEDMFSHSNEFNDIVAEQARIRAEEKKQAEAARKRKHSEPRDQKRRRISNDTEEPVPTKSSSASRERASRTASKVYASGPTSQY